MLDDLALQEQAMWGTPPEPPDFQVVCAACQQGDFGDCYGAPCGEVVIVDDGA